MRNLSEQLAVAIKAIDSANEHDPNRVHGRPLALVQGERATVWLAELVEEPSDALAIAVRAHHLERWVVQRSDFEEGRDGYLRWRRTNKKHQAAQAREIVRAVGYDPDVEVRVDALLNRRGLGSDPDTQALEDVACLVFLETQFEPMVERLDHDHLVDVVAKTLTKMSPQAIALAASLEFTPAVAAVLMAAASDRSPQRQPPAP